MWPLSIFNPIVTIPASTSLSSSSSPPLFPLPHPKCPHDPLPLAPHPPHILTIRPALQLLLLLPIPLLHHALLDIPWVIAVLDTHAEPEIVPVLAARPQLAIAVDVVEVAAKTRAVEGRVEGGAAGHGAREEGVELVIVVI